MSIYYLLDSVLSFEYLEMINILLLFRVGAEQLVVLGGEVEEVETDKTGEESIEEFGWKDFWIMIYSMLIVIPVPIILKAFLARKKLKSDDTIADVHKAKKKMLTKRIIGYTICF